MGLEKADVIDALRIFKSYQDTANEAKFMTKTELEDEQITEADIAQLFVAGGESALEPAGGQSSTEPTG
ncbi:MAG: hypothetical protein IJ685_09455 [Selenomonadaceae bacterium]|nr:hypothetical protein [Selenomonadaceae bacterium]